MRLKGPTDQIGSSIFSLKQNSLGEVFCKNLNGQIFKVSNDSLTLFYAVPKQDNVSHINFFFVDDEVVISSNLYINLHTKNGTFSRQILGLRKTSTKVERFNSVSQLQDGSIHITYFNTDSVYIYKDKKVTSYKASFRNINANSIFFKMGNRLLSVCNGGNVNSSEPYLFQNYTPKNKEQIIFFDQDELIGLGQNKGIHFLIYKNDTLSEGQHFFDEKHISSFCKRKNGMLFFGSFGDGIYVVPNRKVLISEYKHLFLGMEVIDHKLYLSTRDGQVFEATNQLKLVDSQEFNIDKLFSYYGEFSFNSIRQKNLIYGVSRSIKDIYQIDSTHILEASAVGLRLLTPDKNTPIYNLKFEKNRSDSYAIIKEKRFSAVSWSSKDNLIYYCSGFGVFSREWTTGKTKELLFNGVSFLGNSLETNNDTISCGTFKHGILFFKNGKLLFQLSEADGLKSNSIVKHKLVGNRVFILTQKSFQIYDLKNKYFIEPDVKEGIVNSKIKNFELDNNTLWLLEKHRYYHIELETLYRGEKIAELYVDSITVNGKSISLKEKTRFSHTENAFSIYFDYRHFETKSETVLMYTLDGFYEDWKRIGTDVNEINFEYLPSGEYTFKMKAVYRNQETETFEYSFKIVDPFWKTWWFYVLILLALSVLITLIFTWRLRQQKFKSKLINELNTSRLTAIQSQMNPHFIFNALNSIQALVLRGDIDNSYGYINQFSELVRKTLNFSEKDFIEFESELKLIEIYLSLEKLRFPDRFSYTIIPPEDDEFSVPPMLIQPFIENALVHGLLHKLGDKKIEISFEVKDNLICTIIDNGIGRKAAYEINKRQNGRHESFAIKAIENRLDILSKRFSNPVGFEYEDLYDNENNAQGTKVTITIPMRIEY